MSGIKNLIASKPSSRTVVLIAATVISAAALTCAVLAFCYMAKHNNLANAFAKAHGVNNPMTISNWASTADAQIWANMVKKVESGVLLGSFAIGASVATAVGGYVIAKQM